MNRRSLHLASLLLILSSVAASVVDQSKVTSPKEQLGFNFGDDYQLANYAQLTDYWKKLAGQSDRMKLVDIGKSAEGRTIIMAIITAPENQRKLEHYRDIAKQLATAEGLNDNQAHALAAEGKAVVWVDGGLHATEVLGAQQLMELVYQMVSMSDPEFRLKPDASLSGVKPVAWFDSDKPLRSGWAWGQKYLQDGVAVAEASIGKGKLLLFGPEITFRGQPHGTFKFLFNGIYYAGAELVTSK
jgi:hypothetical protein